MLNRVPGQEQEKGPRDEDTGHDGGGQEGGKDTERVQDEERDEERDEQEEEHSRSVSPPGFTTVVGSLLHGLGIERKIHNFREGDFEFATAVRDSYRLINCMVSCYC